MRLLPCPVRPLTCLVLLAGLAAAAACRPAAQQSPDVLTVDGSRFVLNGTPRFLLFVSYFDGLRAAPAALDADLAYLKRIGFDGVRVFPNWWHYRCGGPPLVPAADDGLFTREGSLREAAWTRLVALLDRAAAHRMLVDLSFARETIAGKAVDVPIPVYTAQLREVARRLAGRYPHVLIDVQNEFENNHMSVNDVTALAETVRAEDRPGTPPRIVTASTGGGSAKLAGEAARAARLTVASVHGARGSDWFSRGFAAATLAQAVAAMGPPPRPVHFQEPMPFSDFPGCDMLNDATPGRTREAAVAAKASGAAAWTFHTRVPFALHEEGYEAMLRRPPHAAERAEIESIAAAVTAAAWGTPPAP